MRKLQWILGFCLLSLTNWSQGFVRSLALDSLDARVQSIRLVKEGVLELDFQQCYSGPGLDGCRSGKVWYYIEQDSLGAQQVYHLTHFAGRSDLILLNDSIWLSYGNDGTSCGGRQFLNLKALNLGSWDFKYPTGASFPYSSAAHNMLLIDEGIYAYHGKRYCMGLNYTPLENDTLYYYRLDLYQAQVEYLDTLILPFEMNMPGSLIHDPQSGQNILFYDSLKLYHDPSKREIDSVMIDTSIWVSQSHQASPYYNFQRHYAQFTYQTGQRKEFERTYDTLGYYWLDRRVDWLGQVHWEGLPAVADHPHGKDLHPLLVRRESDSVITYGIGSIRNSDQRLDLYRVVKGQVVKKLRYTAPLDRRLLFTAVSSDPEGNFYLSANLQLKGNRSYWNPDPEAWGAYNVVLIKIDEDGNSGEVGSKNRFYLNQSLNDYRSQPYITFRTANANLPMEYRILDVSGRTLSQNTGYAGDGISIAHLGAGVYYFQLWSQAGDYFGQEAFIVPRL